jgi:hypothetical protein
VMTTMMVVWAGVNPIGVFCAGPVLDRFGPGPVLVAFAAVQTVAMAAVVVSALWARRALQVKTPAPEAVASEPPL